MNENIKNLFNICGMPNEDIMELFEDKNKTFYMEQFAKLIVNECAKVCWDKYRNDDSISHNAGVMFSNDIKKHFGIE